MGAKVMKAVQRGSLHLPSGLDPLGKYIGQGRLADAVPTVDADDDPLPVTRLGEESHQRVENVAGRHKRGG